MTIQVVYVRIPTTVSHPMRTMAHLVLTFVVFIFYQNILIRVLFNEAFCL